jgi:predicted nuclease of predicted toxin-antitoxin system
MKFLLDAHLPRRLAYRFRDAGHDCVHTLDLPEGNHTSDAALLAFVTPDERIVVTKDADFVNSLLLHRLPQRLLLISTGNIANHELETLLVANLSAITEAFATSTFLDITPDCSDPSPCARISVRFPEWSDFGSRSRSKCAGSRQRGRRWHNCGRTN